MATRCRDIMTADPVTCMPTDLVSKAAQIMRDEDVGSVPVVSDMTRKGLIGIVTDRDLAIKVIAEPRDVRTTNVADVMTGDVITCHPDDDVDDVMERMARHQVRRIPVVDADNRIVGIIAQADVAVRTEMPNKTAEVVEKISQPDNLEHVR